MKDPCGEMFSILVVSISKILDIGWDIVLLLHVWCKLGKRNVGSLHCISQQNVNLQWSQNIKFNLKKGKKHSGLTHINESESLG